MTKENVCKNCGKPVDKNAVICTECGVKIKKPVYKKWWFWLIIFVVVVAIGSSGVEKNNDSQTSGTQTTETQPKQEEAIVYEQYTASQLVKDLEDNALKAENKYLDRYVEITGKLSVIDSDGKYISLAPTDNEFTLISVQCYIKNDEQKSQIIELSKGDIVTIKGKINSVGEIMGYSMDIDSIK